MGKSSGIGNALNEWLKWLKDENSPEDNKENRAWGADGELKPRHWFVCLLSPIKQYICPELETWQNLVLTVRIRNLDFARIFWDDLLQGCETWVREPLVPQWWPNSGLVWNSTQGLFCLIPWTLQNGGEFLKHYFFSQSFFGWVLFKYSLIKSLVVIIPCDLICFMVKWTYCYSK